MHFDFHIVTILYEIRQTNASMRQHVRTEKKKKNYVNLIE